MVETFGTGTVSDAALGEAEDELHHERRAASAQAGHGIQIKRVVQMGDQHLLTGIAQLNVEHQIQHVRQALDQLNVAA